MPFHQYVCNCGYYLRSSTKNQNYNYYTTRTIEYH